MPSYFLIQVWAFLHQITEWSMSKECDCWLVVNLVLGNISVHLLTTAFKLTVIFELVQTIAIVCTSESFLISYKPLYSGTNLLEVKEFYKNRADKLVNRQYNYRTGWITENFGPGRQRAVKGCKNGLYHHEYMHYFYFVWYVAVVIHSLVQSKHAKNFWCHHLYFCPFRHLY